MGFAEERRKVTTPLSPTASSIRPSRTTTACTTWRASTTSPRVASTTIGFTAAEPSSPQRAWSLGLGHARAARGRGVGPRARSTRLTRPDRVRSPRAHRPAEDLRPADERPRGPVVRGCATARQEPAVPNERGRPRPPRAPDERGSAAVPPGREERPGTADVRAALRGRRTAPPDRGREEEARWRLAVDP